MMLNSTIYQGCFSTSAMREIWSEQAMVESWLNVEKTLATCQAQQGLIPKSAADALNDVSIEQIDIDVLQEKMQLVGRPIVGLVEQLKSQVEPQFSPFVHYLTTTQDIMDTGCMLQMQTGLAELEQQLDCVLIQLERHLNEQQNTVMLGRTNGQHAIALRFNSKINVWVSELKRRREVLKFAVKNGLMVQVGGPVGDLSKYPGSSGLSVKAAMAEQLNMNVAYPHWQNARDTMGDIMSAIGALCASLCKIAHNINLLASSDIAEVSEGYQTGRGASSSMAHKKNQRASEFAEATARIARQRAEQFGELTLQQHERSGGVMIGEWLVIPDVFLLCSGALLWSEQLFTHLQIHEEVMQAHINAYYSALTT
jgi:3-carboxy-cis,cis-muconate cycloisomerase